MADSLSPSFLGGLMAALQSSQSAPGLQNAGTSPLLNMGLGLMSAAAPHLYVRGNVGEALMGAQQATMQNRSAYQQQAMNDLQTEKLKAMLPGLEAYYKGAAGLMGGSQGGPMGPPPGTNAAPSGIALPQGPMAAPQGAPPMGGMSIDPQTALNLGTMGSIFGAPGAEQLAKYPESYTKVQEAIQTQRKLSNQGPMATLDSAATSDKADTLTNNDPFLKTQWTQNAPRLGFDPVDDLNPQNARSAAVYAYNQMAGSVGLPLKPMPVQLRTIPTGLGGSSQVNPIDNKITPGAPQQETAQFQLPDGSVRLMTKAQGMSQGLTPFNPATFINQSAANSIADRIANYDMAPLSGFALKSAQGQETMRQVLALNPQYDATQYAAKQKGFNQFTSGKQGDTVRSLSVATSHLDTLNTMVNALQNKDTRLFNTVGNKWQQETGAPAPTNFDTVKNIVADEVTKAVIGYGGSAGDREKAAAVIDRANSPAQLKGAIATYKQLMGGQLSGLRRQYEKATGRKDFDSMLSPEAQGQLGSGSAHPPNIQSLLNQYPAAK